MKRILITGGAGFIGSNLAARLHQEGYRITVLDNLHPQIHGYDPKHSSYSFQRIKDIVTFINGDVCDPEIWPRVIPGIDMVVNLAAETGTGQSMYEINRYVEVNIGGTGRLLDYLANNQHNVKKLITASSRAIYGEGRYLCENDGFVFPTPRTKAAMDSRMFEPTCPICSAKVSVVATNESSEVNTSSVYGITKYNQEQLSRIVSSAINLPSVALRFQNVYGPGQSLENPYTGILSIFIKKLLNNEELNVFEDGEESRDFVFISDVVDSLLAVISNKEIINTAINIGSGARISILEIAHLLKEEISSKSKIKVSGDFRIGDIRHNYADIELAKQLFNYEPKVDIRTGINLLCDWAVGSLS